VAESAQNMHIERFVGIVRRRLKLVLDGDTEHTEQQHTRQYQFHYSFESAALK